MTTFLWGVYPYFCVVLFFVVPVLRMVYRPFGFSTRASGLFGRGVLGVASLLLHWGLLVLLVAHFAGFIGGLLGSSAAITFFYWAGLAGGLAALAGSVIALVRRVSNPEVRAMSQWDDYVVHLFLIPILGLGLYQVVFHRIFGVAYTASAWLASVVKLAPQPALMESASAISKVHVLLALTFFAVFPFTKLVHFWTYPVNYFVRPYQSVRTDRFVQQRRWEFGLRSDKSWLVYGLLTLAVVFVASAQLLGWARGGDGRASEVVQAPSGELVGYPLYVSQCARCHGLEGRGDGPGADSPTFAQRPRDFTQGRYHFISTTNGVASDADLARTIRYGLESAGMPGFRKLSDAQVDSLVAVLRGFWKDRPEPGSVIHVPTRPATANAERGADLYRANCAVCHGDSGHGDGPAAAGLSVPPADLADGRIKAGSDSEQIYLRIAAGIPPAGMPGFARSLSEEEIWSLVLYLREELLPRTLASR